MYNSANEIKNTRAACRKYFNRVIFGTYHIGLVFRLFVAQKNLFSQQLKKGFQTCSYFHTLRHQSSTAEHSAFNYNLLNLFHFQDYNEKIPCLPRVPSLFPVFLMTEKSNILVFKWSPPLQKPSFPHFYYKLLHVK